MTEPLVRKSTHDLAFLIASQVASTNLTEEVERYFLAQKQEVSPALQRGFVLPGAIIPSAVPVEMIGYPIEETDCFLWFDHMEQFAERRFGMKISLREMFPLPSRLPWKQVLPIFNPGLTNREMVNKAFVSRKLVTPYESVDVMEYSGSGASVPCLYLTERSAKPTPATMGLPPKFAKHWFAGRQTAPLNLCGYGIGTSLLNEVEKQFLDPETWTWFPENTLSDGHVAYGNYNPGYGKVKFNYNDSDCGLGGFGFREAIYLKPKT
ncbi:MAG: hypothetical protein CEO19_225 [Parcubacteria group bacterium Gr01-1014_73]|nr:MAG: hypothetical protein CEO19_225 [Parcubacteria group bacterium Gr01-1014_73]